MIYWSGLISSWDVESLDMLSIRQPSHHLLMNGLLMVYPPLDLFLKDIVIFSAAAKLFDSICPLLSKDLECFFRRHKPGVFKLQYLVSFERISLLICPPSSSVLGKTIFNDIKAFTGDDYTYCHFNCRVKQ